MAKISSVNPFYQKFPELIERVIIKMGWYQSVILVIFCFNFCLTSISIVVSTFHSYQPDFKCGEYDTNQCKPDGTCDEGYQFLGGDKTIVSEWSLVCSQRLVAPFVNTLYFVGPTMSVCIGSISDWLGRKPTLLVCIYLELICSIGLSFSTNINWFIGIRMLQGFFNQGIFTIVFPLAMEYCPPKKRTLIGLVFHVMWATGIMYLGIMADIFRDWRDMQLTLAIPGILTLAWTWVIPESIQWLCNKQKHGKAFKLLVQIAKRNGSYSEIEEEHRYWTENVQNKTDLDVAKIDDSNHTNIRLNVWDIINSIFTTPCLRKHLLIISSTWFIVTISYYCILFYTPSLATDRHVNFLIGAVIELVVFVTMYYVLSRFGRRIPMLIYLILNGIILGLIGVLASYVKNDLYLTIATLISRGLSASLYFSIELYTIELFPTVNRTCAYGICAVAKQIGNILSPILLPLCYEAPVIPLIVLGVISIAIGLGYILLPETLNIQLPNSIEEAKAIWN